MGRRASTVQDVTRLLALAAAARRAASPLSKGEHRRVLTAVGLLTPQPLLLLDEPFDGLDLRQTREMMDVLREHAAAGRTLFLSIHQLTDAARICDRFVLLSGGRVVGEGTLDELRGAAGTEGGGSRRYFLPSPKATEFLWLVRKEFRELAASRSYWLLLLVVGALVGHAFMTSTDFYAEASGIAGGASALSQGLRPLEGIVVPTFGAYDLAATLLFPFVVIRLVAAERQTGALLAHAPGADVARRHDRRERRRAARRMDVRNARRRRGAARVARDGRTSLRAGNVDGAPRSRAARRVDDRHRVGRRGALGERRERRDRRAHHHAGHVGARVRRRGARRVDRRGRRVHAVGGAARVRAWRAARVDRVRSARSSAVGGLVVATIGLRRRPTVAVPRRSHRWRIRRHRAPVRRGGQLRASRDVSEDRRNSFPRADEAALRSINAPLHITVYLAAEDPRLVDLERGVLSKLRRTMRRRGCRRTPRAAAADCSSGRAITMVKCGTS